MESKNNEAADRSLRMVKTLHAPLDHVWRAWTEPEQIVNWWGPEGFTSTIHVMEVKAGGEWNLTMHGHDGKRYPNKSRYEVIEPGKQIIFQHFNPNYKATVLFEEKGQDTVVDWTIAFDTAESFDTVVRVFKADVGLQQNFDKLERYLAKENP